MRVHFIFSELAAHRLAQQRRRDKRPALHGADTAGDNRFRLADTRHAPKTYNLISFPFKQLTEKINQQPQFIPGEPERLAVIRVTVDIAPMPYGQLVNKPRGTQGGHRYIINFFEHFAHQHDLFIVTCFQQHSAGLAFYSVNGQDIDLQHSEH
ncbi:hypothetical protein D3C87_1692330 [compost metagenome]